MRIPLFFYLRHHSNTCAPSDFTHKGTYKFTLYFSASCELFFCGALNRRTTVRLGLRRSIDPSNPPAYRPVAVPNNSTAWCNNILFRDHQNVFLLAVFHDILQLTKCSATCSMIDGFCLACQTSRCSVDLRWHAILLALSFYTKCSIHTIFPISLSLYLSDLSLAFR